ncbi:MAG TPA: YCF48-related protein [Gammaproteobacteria bacterium]|nr:YCF48-related protein [Gammaproteobacteria bacterium]
MSIVRVTASSRTATGTTIVLLSAVLGALGLEGAAAWAQAPAASPALKGVWEPVNYTEDLELTDVFFVTPEIGYVGGAAATILKTTDAGATWTALLGGDPASTERPVRHLRFVSPTTGWATQNNGNLFQTRDGETWEQVGKLEEHYTDVAFTSETDGVFATGNDIYQTRDGGRTWPKVFTCAVKGQIAGLSRVLDCEIIKMSFVSATVGFAIGFHNDAVLVLKTDDGGSSWSATNVMEGESGRDAGIFFLDENTGYLGGTYSGRSYRTNDGGLTWTGMPATALTRNIRFADPEIGWAFGSCTVGPGCANAMLSYTVDGGRRWASRSYALPAPVKAFSLPRRDVAYAVGEHGMIYRYRAVPEETPLAANAIEAIAMPPLANGVIEQLAELEVGLGGIETAVAATGDVGAARVVEPAADAELGWVEANFTEFGEFEATFDTVATGLPEMGSKHRNLNLLLEGLKLLRDLAGEGAGLKDAFTGLREARDPASVSAALLEMHAQLEAAQVSVTAFETTSSFGP